MFPLPEFTVSIRRRAKATLALAAEWHRKNQVRHAWPFWTADAGRFASSASITDPSERPSLSICWNTARGAQALLSAYKILKDPAVLETAKLALEYVKTCQIFSPESKRHHGACCEETAQANHIASRDTVEAVQGFTNMYHVTGEEVYLLRARAGADWLSGRFLGSHYPNGYVWHTDNDRGSVNNDFSRLMLSAMALVFAQIDAITGEKRYVAAIPRVMDWVVENSIEPDGAMKIHDGTHVGHHAVTTGPLADCFTNDDGVGVAMIAAFRATGEKKYREAVERNGGWWLGLNQLPETFASVPAGLVLLLDMARFTGNEGYVRAAGPYIDKVLSMQYLNPKNPQGHGGFMGLDMEGGRECAMWKSKPEDYVSHRTTMYAMMALAKIAAETEADWNIAYSSFGY
jgi:rhamnogalacturonyl hydrolase YesR